jgi:nucleoside-diphosphate-sugar epimerase
MRILLTGCFGFIGSNLLPKLLNDMHSVIGFDNLSNVMPDVTDRVKSQSGPTWTNFKFYKQDIRSFESMHSILIYEKPDLIIHLAASGSVPRSFEVPADYVENNEKGFVNICKIAKAFNIKKVVYASSSSVYGESNLPEKTESDQLNPMSPYAVSKLQNELFARVWSSHTGIEMIGLRFFNVYGPGQNIFVKNIPAIPSFIINQKPTLNGDGSNQRDFTFVSDVVDAIVLSSTINLKEKFNVFNIGCGESHTLNSILSLLGKKEVTKNLSARVGDVKTSKANINKAKTKLGYSPKIQLKDGIEKTKHYYDLLSNGA